MLQYALLAAFQPNAPSLAVAASAAAAVARHAGAFATSPLVTARSNWASVWLSRLTSSEAVDCPSPASVQAQPSNPACRCTAACDAHSSTSSGSTRRNSIRPALGLQGQHTCGAVLLRRSSSGCQEHLPWSSQVACTAVLQQRGITTRPSGRRVNDAGPAAIGSSGSSSSPQAAPTSSNSSTSDSWHGDEQGALLQQAQQQRLQVLQDSHAPQLQPWQDDAQQLQFNQQQAALRSVLTDANLSFSATMAVLKHNHLRRLNADAMRPRIRHLQEAFGANMVNAVLSLVPELLERSAERVVDNFAGLSRVLGAGDSFARELVVRCPDILAHRPATVQHKMEHMAEVLQADRAALLSLVRKAPVLLKVAPATLRSHAEVLAQLCGRSPQQVCKVYTAWPVLATTSTALLKARHTALARLLSATAEDMARICRNSPSLLGRDPSQLDANLTQLAQQLGLPKDQLVALMRKEPGLMNWNVSTLLNRMMAVRQMLKLPPQLALTLLAFNRPLLSYAPQMPQKLQVLKRVLGVTDEQLYPLVHGYMTLLRFPVHSVEAKVACAGSLACLSERWTGDWKAFNVLAKVRTVQAGWACHWRLVYLLHSGQSHTCSMLNALRSSHKNFCTAYPDFLQWLHRYNQAVRPPGVPILSQLPPSLAASVAAGMTGPACFPSILLDVNMGHALHAGSVYLKNRQAEIERQSSLLSSADCSSSSSSGAAAEGNDAATGLQLHPTSEGRLAAWLGVDPVAAQQLLRVRTLSVLRWKDWKARLDAAAGLLAVVGHSSSSSSSCSSQVSGKPTGTAGSSAVVAVALASSEDSLKLGNSIGSSRRRHRSLNAPAYASVPATCQGSSSHSSRRRRQSQLPSAAAVDAAALSAAAGSRRRSSKPRGEPFAPQDSPQLLAALHSKPHPQSWQWQQHIDVQTWHPKVKQALQHALGTGQSLAVAGVAVACLLAPFSQELYCTPARPPEAVVQLVLQHPAEFAKATFEENCISLAALAQVNAPLRAELAAMQLQELVAHTCCRTPRMRYLQYLVQTQQAVPWAFGLRWMLLNSYLTIGQQRERFSVAYPGFVQWEQSMTSL